ncbi:MAG: hypothetical protein Q9168_001021 [Polycauliona sp. 1 TL-2023]
MSRSYSYSSNHPRSSRQPHTPNLAVTEASFQSLQLSDTSLPSSYSTSNQYPSRGSYGQANLSTNYLTPGYEAASYASSSPSGSYLGPQRAVSPFASLGQDPSGLFDPDPSSYSKTDMSYSYHRAPLPGSYEGHGSYASSRSPSMHDYAYAGGDASSRRTPSTSSSYDISSSSGYPRTSTTSSAPYLSGVSGSSNPYGPSYASNYSPSGPIQHFGQQFIRAEQAAIVGTVHLAQPGRHDPDLGESSEAAMFRPWLQRTAILHFQQPASTPTREVGYSKQVILPPLRG